MDLRFEQTTEPTEACTLPQELYDHLNRNMAELAQRQEAGAEALTQALTDRYVKRGQRITALLERQQQEAEQHNVNAQTHSQNQAELAEQLRAEIIAIQDQQRQLETTTDAHNATAQTNAQQAQQAGTEIKAAIKALDEQLDKQLHQAALDLIAATSATTNTLSAGQKAHAQALGEHIASLQELHQANQETTSGQIVAIDAAMNQRFTTAQAAQQTHSQQLSAQLHDVLDLQHRQHDELKAQNVAVSAHISAASAATTQRIASSYAAHAHELAYELSILQHQIESLIDQQRPQTILGRFLHWLIYGRRAEPAEGGKKQ